jgi:hypothetical protein
MKGTVSTFTERRFLMVAYFRRMNILLMVLGGAAGAAFGFLALKGQILNRQNMAGIFIFALFIAAGIVAGRLLSARLSARRLRAIYSILYKENDPRRFISVFGPLLEGVPRNLAEYMDGCCHLSFAYQALGDLDSAWKAVEGLRPGDLKLHALTVTSRIVSQKAGLALLQKDAEKAGSFLKDLELLRNAAEKRAPMLAGNLKECIRLQKARTDALKLLPETDTAYLEEEIRVSANVIHRKEIQLELAAFFMERGEAEKARPLLEDLLSTEYSLASEEKARILLSQL